MTVHPRSSCVAGWMNVMSDRWPSSAHSRASALGSNQAREIARGLVEADYVVVSGLAAGIDTAGQEAAIAAGGRTVAVIGTGFEGILPEEQCGTTGRSLETEHAVISQFWPGQGARKWTFPQRNAVMSGFARATIVVEASHTSGAKMQARLALKHGRPVFLLQSLMEHEWARGYARRPGSYVVEHGAEIVSHLDRLYAVQLTLRGLRTRATYTRPCAAAYGQRGGRGLRARYASRSRCRTGGHLRGV